MLHCCSASGLTSAAGEQCVVAGELGLGLEPCLEAIAAGDGREVMQFDEEGSLCECCGFRHFFCTLLIMYIVGR